MAIEERVTYCRICEPLCGLIATVEDGRLARLRPDKDHPLSRGFACPKGIAFTEVQNDPDRVLYPLRRTATGTFQRVTWEQALGEIGDRLHALIRAHGGSAVGWYMGNPATFSYTHSVWIAGVMKALRSPHLYTAGSQDINSRFAASALLYGGPTLVPIPDLARTSFLFMLGANPLVSHGSALSAPRIKDQLKAIVDRGGRVVVVDPRRTETARAHEHLPVVPDTDAWLLLAMLSVIFEEGLADARALREHATGTGDLRRLAAECPPEVAAEVTGVPADRIRELARDFAAAPSAAAYGRVGSNIGSHGTLVAFLLDALTVVTGNLHVAGGAVFGTSPLMANELARLSGQASYGRTRSRQGGFPDVLGSMPAALLAREITDRDSPQRLRALVLSSGNPVLSLPNSAELTKAFAELDLLVSIDLYVNESNRHADYILPATTFLEREDIPLPFLQNYSTPFMQTTEAVLAPYGEARQEWHIIDDLARRAGVLPFLPLRLGALRGLLPKLPRVPVRLALDLVLRLGRDGDRFGLRPGGLSLRRLRARPHGVVLAEHLRVGDPREHLWHRDRRVHLCPPEIVEEVAALRAGGGTDGGYPLRLIGMRDLRSHNSWMHNSPTLLRGVGGKHRPAARVHPADAEAAGITDGARCRITSAHGHIELDALLTDEVRPGTIAVPHGWGHRGGSWRLANATGGANVNELASSDVADLEKLAGMAKLTGIPVRLEVAPPRSEPSDSPWTDAAAPVTGPPSIS
jgi:anaerobic selenocysteine-containing dehydrogenase